MKKTLSFLGLLCGMAGSVFAQTTQERNNGTAQTAAVTLVPMGSSSLNVYGGFVENKHTLAYNPELNLLVFGHRGGGAAGGIGNQVYFDYSTNGGAGWTPQVAMVNPITDDPELSDAMMEIVQAHFSA